MRLLIIRHADPDYAIDGLTSVGQREAELLADRMAKENIQKVYCSTLGRARATAAPTLRRTGMTAEYCEWLREFNYAKIFSPWFQRPAGAWDLLPDYMNEHPDLYHPKEWLASELIRDTEIPAAYASVTASLDRMLEYHGYRRDGYCYKAVLPNHDTVALFCHYGVTAVLLSHLMNCSPYSIWQHIVTLPTAVTVLHTEERRAGTAHFRAVSIGDTSHLYFAGQAPSFSARFCECFTDDTRHD